MVDNKEIDWNSEELERLKDMIFNQRLSNRAIAKKYNVGTYSIEKIIKKFGFKRTEKPKSFNIKNEKRNEAVIQAVKDSYSISEVLRKLELNNTGGNREWLQGKISSFKLDTSHFTGQGHMKGKINKLQKKDLKKDILKENSSFNTNHLRERLIKEGLKEYKCECCGNTEWNEKPIPLQLHHINGIRTDNRIENLQILCPNCHAQTDNYCSKNIKNPNEKKILIPDKEEFLKKAEELGFIYKLSDYYNISESLLRKWIKELKIKKEIDEIKKKNIKNKKEPSGSRGFIKESKPFPDSVELLDKIRELEFITCVADFYNVSEPTLRKWINKLNLREEVNKIIQENYKKRDNKTKYSIPDKEELISKIKELKSMTKLCKFYNNVDHKTIRRWMRKLDIEEIYKEIKNTKKL